MKFIIITLLLFTSIEAHGAPRRQIREIENHDNIIKIKNFKEPTEMKNNDNTEFQRDFNTTKSTKKYVTGKKWQVGKVSRKQYEIVNMLWRKTNIFDDEVDESITDSTIEKATTRKLDKNNRWNAPLTLENNVRSSKTYKQSTTPSYIEFYYLDEIVDQRTKNNDQHSHHVKQQLTHKAESDKIKSRLPFFMFHVNEPLFTLMPVFDTSKKDTTVDHIRSNTGSKVSAISFELGNHIIHDTPSNFEKSHKNSYSRNLNTNHDIYIFDNNSHGYKIRKHINLTVNDTKYSRDNNSNTESTKVYDRIKFFEIYDSHTLEPKKSGQRSLYYDDNEIVPETNDQDNDNKILLDHIDKDLKHTEEVPVKKYEKKHVKSYEFESKSLHAEEFEANMTIIPLNSSVITAESIVHRQQFFNKNYSEVSERNSSRCASWLEYPFVAVYVYELYRIYCDAAIISPHWLLASGSCLSQHRIKDIENSRSAYVTYCGSNWWNPERITYVKTCTIHPRYNTMDKRKYLYNIGLIQVISSMASACNNWTPVSLMSHQYAAESDGSFASAVGWGLDRFITRPITDLPRSPLTVFEGKVFSNSCPGNSVYQKLNYINSEFTKNIYCLLLPPYAGEEKDTVHGGLLFVGGKLIALFLQEERRHFGFQSAIYTGLWKLVPWINHVANEPEEADFLI